MKSGVCWKVILMKQWSFHLDKINNILTKVQDVIQILLTPYFPLKLICNSTTLLILLKKLEKICEKWLYKFKNIYSIFSHRKFCGGNGPYIFSTIHVFRYNIWQGKISKNSHVFLKKCMAFAAIQNQKTSHTKFCRHKF